ncbi:MAG: hypothetical protein WBV66_12475, partial [Pseudolabrys sp.]
MSQPASLTWLAGHEFRLGWRDWTSLMTAGGRTRARTATIALTAFAAFMHVFAFWTVASYANAHPTRRPWSALRAPCCCP